MLAMNSPKISSIGDRIQQLSSRQYARFRRLMRALIVYAPGVSLVLLGFTVLCLPPAVPSVLALFLVCSGMVVIRITSLACQLFRHLQESLRGVDGRVVLQGVVLRESHGDTDHAVRPAEGDAKKDWLH